MIRTRVVETLVRPAFLQEINMSAYDAIADKTRAYTTTIRDEPQEWLLNDQLYLQLVEEEDQMGFIVAIMMNLMVMMGIPERFSPMNRRGPSDIWKIGILVIQAFSDKSWSGFVPILSGMRGVLRLGGLDKAPDESTFRKFIARLPESMLDDIIAETGRLCGVFNLRIAVDGTGFTDSNASIHYLKRIYQITKKEADRISRERKMEIEELKKAAAEGKEPKLKYSCVPVRGYTKVTLAGNVDTLAILACDVVHDHSADVTRMMPTLSQLAKYNFLVDLVLADKGYDAEYIHEQIRELFHCDVIIPARQAEPAREWHPEQIATKGFFRKRMVFDWEKLSKAYGMRSIIECINSVLKRLFGGEVSSKKNHMKDREVKICCIAHNIFRMMDLRVI